MLFFGKKLDPQPLSEVARGAGRGRTRATSTGMAATRSMGGHGRPHAPLKKLIDLICPGMVLLSFIFSAGAVCQLRQLPVRAA